MKKYIKLFRLKHCIKNFLIFMPMFFGGSIFDVQKLIHACLGFLCFCMATSAVYIWNDYCDMEKDRMHPTKKNRPLASGEIKSANAFVFLGIFLALAVIISMFLNSIGAIVCLLLYLLLNSLYSMGLKNKPIIDIAILAAGFVIRVFYGGFVENVEISKWLYLVVTTGSLYMGLGKRRNEIKLQSESREVLKYYNEAFLDKNMYVCLALANVFYALWTLEMPNGRISWTIPFFIIILMRYSLDAEGNSDGDPVEVILKDKVLIGLIVIYAICIFSLLYLV